MTTLFFYCIIIFVPNFKLILYSKPRSLWAWLFVADINVGRKYVIIGIELSTQCGKVTSFLRTKKAFFHLSTTCRKGTR